MWLRHRLAALQSWRLRAHFSAFAENFQAA
jgi:hypothetical protein